MFFCGFLAINFQNGYPKRVLPEGCSIRRLTKLGGSVGYGGALWLCGCVVTVWLDKNVRCANEDARNETRNGKSSEQESTQHTN